MLSLLAGAFALAAAVQQPMDTTFRVRADAQVDIYTFAGSISVKTWNKNEIRLVATHSSRDRVIVSGDEGSVKIRSSGKYGTSFTVDIEVTVPAGVSLKLGGQYTDITSEGTEGEIEANTTQGDVRVSGGRRFVTLSSVEGPVSASNVNGKLHIRAVNREVKATNITGPVLIDGINGWVKLENVNSPDLDVATVNGDITFQGQLADKGVYHFGTHNGAVVLTLPEKTHATLSVVTYGGSISSDFAVTAQPDAGANRRRKTYVIGNGSAKVEIESFQGSVRLRKPGSSSDREQEQ
jgi:DUF4097 and DUF4098 domain-containing protein YvlB